MAKELSPRKKSLLGEAVDRLAKVPGVVAVALGGSHARGTQMPQSDIDIGLYYHEAAPFSIESIREIARALSDSGLPTVSGFYEWGPFVNGGAWIDNAICKIDFLYRNLNQLAQTLDEAEQGKWQHSFDQQPPFGFRSVTTLGEIFYCQPIFDPSGILVGLKSRVAIFPRPLKAHIVESTLWAAEFSFMFAETLARDGDVPNTVGCMTRIFHYLVHALFALNETYLVNEKRIASVIEGFTLCPAEFYPRANRILGHVGTTSEALTESLDALRVLWSDVVAIAGEGYRSRAKPPSR